MKQCRKIVSLIVTFAICSHFLGGIVDSHAAEITTENAMVTEGLSEDISLRSENTKHFQIADGGYIAAVYDEAVHYADETGVWEDVDNTLVLENAVPLSEQPMPVQNTSEKLTETAFAASYFENKTNPFKVRLPATINGNQPVLVTYNGFTLGFRLSDVASTALAQVSDSNIAADNAELVARAASATDVDTQQQLLQEAAVNLPNLTSSVSYADILPKTDLQYQITGKRLKEYMIFDEPPTENSVSYDLFYTGLVPVLEESGTVNFYDAAHPDQDPIFVITAPYMFDAMDNLTTDIEVALTATEEGSRYTLTMNDEWLNDPQRVYPVTLDPQVTTSTSTSDIEDAGVQESNPDTNYYSVDRIYVGSVLQGTTAYEGRMFIRFPRVAAIPGDVFIREATMYLDHYPNSAWQTANNLVLDVFEVGNNNWSSSTITWNTQKNYSFGSYIGSFVSDKSYSGESCDITDAVRKWYAPNVTSNNGLFIKPSNKDTAKTNRTCYYSSDVAAAYANNRPRVTIEYYSYDEPDGINRNATYFIRSYHSGKYLDVTNSGGGNTAICQHGFNGDQNQQWQVKYMGGGVYSFIPQHYTSLRLDVPNGNDADGQDLVVYYENNGKNQYFRIIENGDSSYRIMPLCSTTRVLDVESASTSNSAPIQIWTWTGEPQMRWYFDPPNRTVKTNINSSVNSGYNRVNAANYAEQYAIDHNTEYEYFASGGDCTNFVSQCVVAGGMPMLPGNVVWGITDKTNVQNWFYIPGALGDWYSVTFTSATNFNRHWGQDNMRAYQTIEYATGEDALSDFDFLVSQLYPGDIIQMKDGNGGFSHSMIICSVGVSCDGAHKGDPHLECANLGESEIVYAQHTGNFKNGHLRKVLDDYKNTGFVFIRIKRGA